MNKLTPEQMVKLAKWLPDLVHFNGINLQWWHNGKLNAEPYTALGRSVHETELDYLCRMAEKRMGRKQVDLVAFPAQRIDALPEPKG